VLYSRRMDVAIIGAGIIGCSAAAFLAEAGASVVVYDREDIAAGASGRNSGVLQHPISGPLAPLFEESLPLHREMLDLPDAPDGILVLGRTDIDGIPSHLEPQLVDDAHELEPLVRPSIPAVRVNTGWVVGPQTATRAWAARAQRAGAQFDLGGDTVPKATRTLIATGAWTNGVTALYGVTAVTNVRSRHVLEEGGTDDAVEGEGGEVFTLVGDVLGTSASYDEPDTNATAKRLQARAKQFIGEIELRTTRQCPRPLSPDGLPLVGQLDERTFVCAGHGAWGISVGPATARLITQIMSGQATGPASLNPQRF
jgi:glycine/D-amino acid oxidase-like deaminating enzyme